MPELPEVETLRLDLGKEVTGRKIKVVAVANGRRCAATKAPSTSGPWL